MTPSYSEVLDAACARICMGCDDTRHEPGAHYEDVVQVVDELIDREWLVTRDVAPRTRAERAEFEAGKWWKEN